MEGGIIRPKLWISDAERNSAGRLAKSFVSDRTAGVRNHTAYGVSNLCDDIARILNRDFVAVHVENLLNPPLLILYVVPSFHLSVPDGRNVVN